MSSLEPLEGSGYFLAHNPEMEKWAEKQVKKGTLKRLWELAPYLKRGKIEVGFYSSTYAHAFVPKSWTVDDLKKYFPLHFLVGAFGLTELEPEMKAEYNEMMSSNVCDFQI